MIFKNRDRFIPFLPTIDIRALYNNPFNNLKTSEGMLFGRSREVIAASITSLDIKKGDVILVPASLCWDALAPVLAQGVIVRCYPLDHQLNVDVKSLMKITCAKTKAVYIVHYFGYPQPNVSEIKKWSQDEGFRLIEDCALCPYNSKTNIGRWGDVSFFSLWKTLPLLDGAIAFTKNNVSLHNLSNYTNRSWRTKRLLGLISNGIGSNSFSVCKRNFRSRLDELAPYEPPGPAVTSKITEMSAISKYIFYRSHLEKIADKRRENYKNLADGIRDIKGVRIIWQDYPIGSSPFAMPIYVNDPVSIKRGLALNGVESEISVNRFFRTHPGIQGDQNTFEIVDELADHIISLPIHQAISNYDISKLIRVLREII